ncbi:MAG TPA: hypothetical protein VFQ30_06610, partial [Ktedonobacteraceae bacterium]|nr:hypothetical protein [Ktedonobacteraceae bacterium]
MDKLRVTGKTVKRRRPGNIIARIVLALLFCLGFFLSVLPPGRAIARTALLLPSFIGASEPAPLKLLGEPVRHTQSTIRSSNGPVYLDIYAPISLAPRISGVREGVVVIPGVGDERKEQQLINFSQALAQVGIVVMDITTPTLIRYDLSPKDSDAVVQAFKTLSHWSGLSANHIGLIGFSGGGALVTLAAADPRIRDEVASLTLFGSYYNAFSLLHDFGRRALDDNGHLQPWHPQEVSIQVMTSIIADELPGDEGALLTSSLDPGGSPLSTSEQQQLSPAGQAAYHLLEGDEPDKVDANIAALTPQIKTLLQQLSPSSVINQIRAP